MKYYKVFFIIKHNGHGYLNEGTVSAKNQKEAIKKVRERTLEFSGSHAFSATCKPPKLTESGMEFNGKIYTGYSEMFNRLW